MKEGVSIAEFSWCNHKKSQKTKGGVLSYGNEICELLKRKELLTNRVGKQPRKIDIYCRAKMTKRAV